MQQQAEGVSSTASAQGSVALDDESVTLPEGGVRLVVMGVSGCGKSHVGQALAACLGAQFIDGDDYHGEANVAKMARGIPLNDEDRHGWLTRLAELIDEARREGRSLVLACSSLKRRYRDQLRGGDAALGFVFLEGTRELLLERLEARTDHFFKGAAMLDDQLATLEVPERETERVYTLDISATPQALVEQVCQQLTAQHASSKALTPGADSRLSAG
ncbi:gluconokinase [Cobetia marina]